MSAAFGKDLTAATTIGENAFKEAPGCAISRSIEVTCSLQNNPLASILALLKLFSTEPVRNRYQPCDKREDQVSQDHDASVGDFYEGVLLETCRDEDGSITRPRVRPLEYFPKSMRVEFPRSLREKHPIGTRFRADVTVGQKHWSSGVAKGPPYLVARPSSIVRDISYTPEIKLMAVPKPGTISGRAHDYELVDAGSTSTTIFELREQAYLMADISPPQERREVWQRTRSAMIAQYALCRSRGDCEGCKNPAPFMRRNGEPYLEVHHIRALADGGADHPLNVAAVCPNCHSRVTHGRDANEYNAVIAQNVKTAEAKLEVDST